MGSTEVDRGFKGQVLHTTQHNFGGQVQTGHVKIRHAILLGRGM